MEKIQDRVRPREGCRIESALMVRTHLEVYTERSRLNRTPCGLMTGPGHRMSRKRDTIVKPGEALTCETCRQYRDAVREKGPVEGEPIIQGGWTLTAGR